MATERKYTPPAEDEIDYAAGYQARVENGFTALQDHFGDWIAEKAEPSFKTQKELDAFILGAKTALWLRMYHQRSPENHAFKVEQKENRSAEQEEKDAARAEKVEARAKALADKEAAKEATAKERAAAKAAKAGTETPAPAKATRGKAAAAKTATATPAKATGRGAKTAAAATTAKAPATKAPARRPAANGTTRPARRATAKAEAEF